MVITGKLRPLLKILRKKTYDYVSLLLAGSRISFYQGDIEMILRTAMEHRAFPQLLCSHKPMSIITFAFSLTLQIECRCFSFRSYNLLFQSADWVDVDYQSSGME